MHPPITHRHDQHPAHDPLGDAELLAVAAAMGVTRTPAEPVVAEARHRPGDGRRRPGWLVRPRPGRRGCLRRLGRGAAIVAGTAAFTAVAGWAPFLALGAALLLLGADALTGGVR